MKDHQFIFVIFNSNGTTNAHIWPWLNGWMCCVPTTTTTATALMTIHFVLWVCCENGFIIIIKPKHLPIFPSLLSNCIIVRWMLPFGLSADVLNFFLRWINSIFHGGKSAYKCELGGTVVLDDDAAMMAWYPISVFNIKIAFQNIDRNWFILLTFSLINLSWLSQFSEIEFELYTQNKRVRIYTHIWIRLSLSITVCFSGICFIWLFFFSLWCLSLFFFFSLLLRIVNTKSNRIEANRTDRIKHKTHTNARIHTQSSINCT